MRMLKDLLAMRRERLKRTGSTAGGASDAYEDDVGVIIAAALKSTGSGAPCCGDESEWSEKFGYFR